jgi:hypothetical protein
VLSATGMQSISKRGAVLGLAVGLLGIATGCAGRWDVPTTELRRLQGYREGQEVTLRDEEGEAVRFNRDSAIEILEPGFQHDEVRRLKFSAIHRADETAIEGTLAPLARCPSWINTPTGDVPGPACSPGAEGVFDLHGIDRVGIVRAGEDDPPSAVGAPRKDNTRLAVGVGVTLGVVAVVATTVAVVYGLKSLSGIGGGFGGGGGLDYRGAPGRGH